ENGATGNTVGGTAAGARNVISGNRGDGIDLTGSTTAGNVVQGNFIGTDLTGAAALGNGIDGVRSTGTTANTIRDNVITANPTANVDLSGNGTLAGTVSWFHGDGAANDALGNNNGSFQGTASYTPGVSG